ncbi:membrane steroid-binding protein 2-like [Humulus lupulus]|uniref:membrane steroid-binding protein 2-like n=1 Tax=Humulus lupulus TaxID=3486 RepID=UPI002B404145|nr:membrane steroid-binding protein 2-like [Humulus lupulus]
MAIYSGVMEEITSYTGLSPAAFFTIAALVVVVFRTVSAMFVSPEDFNKPPVAAAVSLNPNNSSSNNSSSFLNGVLDQTTTKPVQLGDITQLELSAYNGSDPNKPLLISVRGQIYDVSSSRMFYGPGGPYAMFTGKEASRALALLSFKPQDMNDNLEDLGPDELQVLEDWEDKFIEKYPKVGKLVKESTTTEQPSQSGEELKKEL